MKKAFWDVDLYTGGEDGERYTKMRVFLGGEWDLNKMRMGAVGSIMRFQDVK